MLLPRWLTCLFQLIQSVSRFLCKCDRWSSLCSYCFVVDWCAYVRRRAETDLRIIKQRWFNLHSTQVCYYFTPTLPTSTVVAGEGLLSASVCLFFTHDNSKTRATRIIKRDRQMFHHESWKSIYFEVKTSSQCHEAQKQWRRGLLHSCGCWLLLVTVGRRSIAIIVSVGRPIYVCLSLSVWNSVCLSVCSHCSKQISPKCLYILPLAVNRSSSDGNAIRYVLPVLWTMSCFCIM